MDVLKIFDKYPLLIARENNTYWEGYLSTKAGSKKFQFYVPNFPSAKSLKLKITPEVLKLFQSNYQFNGSFLECLEEIHKSVDKLLEPTINHWSHQQISCFVIILEELKETFGCENILKISDNFEWAKVKYEDSNGSSHYIKFSLPSNYPGGTIDVLEVNLPSDTLTSLYQLTSIKKLHSSFTSLVEALVPFWNICEELETNSWVIEPEKPEKRDTFRRIYIDADLSVLLQLNPLSLYSIPDIKFIGSTNRMEAMQSIFHKNLKFYGWDEELSVLENLSQILEIERFPIKIEQSSIDLFSAKCTICTGESDEDGPVSKWCNNNSCSSACHQKCLIKWLDSTSHSKEYFDYVCGPCPNCKTNLMCPRN